MSSLEPYVARLYVYPIKSLDWVECDRVTVLASGAIQGDRTWAIFDERPRVAVRRKGTREFDEQDRFVNGKNNAKIHALRSQFDLEAKTITLQIEGDERSSTFSLEHTADLCPWLEEYFGFPVTIKQNLERGFPDDTISPGATIVSTATLEAIASWYPELNLEDIRRRFRANIEIAGVPAFWEDRLFAEADTIVKFQVGTVEFIGVNPCQRCVVVTRNPRTGEAYPQFQKTFIRQRKATLPEWSERSRFNHFFRLAVNTKLSPKEAGKTIAVGDLIKLEES